MRVYILAGVERGSKGDIFGVFDTWEKAFKLYADMLDESYEQYELDDAKYRAAIQSGSMDNGFYYLGIESYEVK